jgi:hypothetical protein
MPDDVSHKTPMQWAALVGAGSLVWVVLWNIGTQFRDYLRVDNQHMVSEHIAVHEKTATASRQQFFDAIESRADRAIDRIGELEQNCAKFGDWRGATDSRLSVLEKWHQQCSAKQSEFTQWMGRDSRDVEELKRDFRELRADIYKRK